MKKRTLLGLMAGLPLTPVLTACGGGDSNDARVRLVNASTGYASLDLYTDDELLIPAVAYGSASDFADVGSGTVTTALTVEGSSTELITQSRSLKADVKYSIVAYGWDGALKTTVITENQDAADSGEVSVRVLNTATDAGAVDVYLTDADTSLASATPVASNVSAGTTSAFNTTDAGTYRLRVTAAGDTDDVRLDVSGVVVDSTSVVTLIITPTSGGLLVNAVKVVQGGDVLPLSSSKARIRVFAMVADGASVSATLGADTLAGAVKAPSIRSYALVDAGTKTLTVSVNGTALPSQALTLDSGADVSVLVAGPADAPQLTVISDDNRLPTISTKFKLRMVHASTLLKNQALTLSLDLQDLVNGLDFAAASEVVTLTAVSGSTLTVSSLDLLDPVFELTEQDLVAKGVYTLMVYDTSGGVTTAKLMKDR